MIKRSRANTEVASSAKVVVFKCRFFLLRIQERVQYKDQYLRQWLREAELNTKIIGLAAKMIEIVGKWLPQGCVFPEIEGKAEFALDGQYGLNNNGYQCRDFVTSRS